MICRYIPGLLHSVRISIFVEHIKFHSERLVTLPHWNILKIVEKCNISIV